MGIKEKLMKLVEWVVKNLVKGIRKIYRVVVGLAKVGIKGAIKVGMTVTTTVDSVAEGIYGYIAGTYIGSRTVVRALKYSVIGAVLGCGGLLGNVV